MKIFQTKLILIWVLLNSAILMAKPFNVMTYNIRHYEVCDGFNDPALHWVERQKYIINNIISEDVDILGIQEASYISEIKKETCNNEIKYGGYYYEKVKDIYNTYDDNQTKIYIEKLLNNKTYSYPVPIEGRKKRIFMLRRWLITTLKEKGYEAIDEYTLDTTIVTDKKPFNASPKFIFIKTNKFKSIDHGQIKFKKEPDIKENFHRTATWAIVQKKDNNKYYFIINTHLSSGSGNKNYAVRISQVQDLKSQLAELNPNGYPMIIMGDMNSNGKIFKQELMSNVNIKGVNYSFNDFIDPKHNKTYNDFNTENNGNHSRLDYIVTDSRLTTFGKPQTISKKQYNTNKTNIQECTKPKVYSKDSGEHCIYASDHHPLITTIDTPTKYDFNNDGIADILWRKGDRSYIWYMKKDGTHTPTKSHTKPSSYSVVAIADFNNDGIADILWRSGHTNHIWYMNSNGTYREKNIGGKENYYSPVAIADFNNDGITDILWRNGSVNHIWYMNNNGSHKYKRISGKEIQYSLVTTADFNNDGIADILWRNGSVNHLWLMNTDGSHKYKNIGKKSTSYTLVTATDFNNDGIADILWRKGSLNALWYMKSNGTHTYKNIGTKSIDYSIVSVADFNNDGIADILWKKGQGHHLWKMNSNGSHQYKYIGKPASGYTIP